MLIACNLLPIMVRQNVLPSSSNSLTSSTVSFTVMAISPTGKFVIVVPWIVAPATFKTVVAAAVAYVFVCMFIAFVIQI